MIELIRTRRSVRRYEDRPLSDEVVEILEEAALRAPTSRNRRSWEFVFVTDPATIRRLAALKPTGAEFLAGAPLAVAVLGDPSVSDVWVEDASIAAILLQMTAHSLGLGSCWAQVRLRDREDGRSADEHVRALLGAPDRLRALAVIGIGHPAESRDPVPASTLPRGKIHRDRW